MNDKIQRIEEKGYLITYVRMMMMMRTTVMKTKPMMMVIAMMIAMTMIAIMMMVRMMLMVMMLLIYYLAMSNSIEIKKDTFCFVRNIKRIISRLSSKNIVLVFSEFPIAVLPGTLESDP